jgi:hypothetical protein
LLPPKDYCKVESAPAAAALALKVAERNQVKNVEVKSIMWGDIIVGDIKSQQVQDKGVMVKSVVTILGYKAELFTADQIRQLCAHLKLTGYWSKSKDETLGIIVVGKFYSDVYDATGITGQGTDEKEKQPAKTKSCVFCLINLLFLQ